MVQIASNYLYLRRVFAVINSPNNLPFVNIEFIFPDSCVRIALDKDCRRGVAIYEYGK